MHCTLSKILLGLVNYSSMYCLNVGFSLKFCEKLVCIGNLCYKITCLLNHCTIIEKISYSTVVTLL